MRAQTGDDPPGPCPYVPIDLNTYGGQDFKNPLSIASKNGSLDTPLIVKYTDPAVTKIANCPLTLRSFDGKLGGPTLRLKPGDTLYLHLKNELPKESAAEVKRQYEDEAGQAHIVTKPHSFNTTNMHYHGLHVSPSGNSDNVLLAIRPGEEEDYVVKIPANHPSGTFWYHPHAHGSTAVQVGSGMAGALIIEDDPAKLPPSLREASSPEHEKILEFQSILYNQQGKVDNIESFFPSPSIPTEDNCKQFSGPKPHQTSEGTWECSHRMTTVNGQLIPIIKMRPGEVARWRFIDTSFRESIQLQLDDHVLHEIALDGIYTGTIDDWGPDNPPLDLEPGYRSDVLVQAKPCTAPRGRAQELLLLRRIPALAAAAGGGNCRYGLWNRATPPTQSLRADQQRENLLAILEVEGLPMNMTLPTAQEMQSLAPFPGVDLKKKLGQEGGPIGVQQVAFKLGTDLRNPGPDCDPSGPCSPPDKTCADNKEGCPTNYFQVNYASFNPNNVRKLKLGSTEQWTITTVGDPRDVPGHGVPPLPHVFHIHVNPFQYTRQDPSGNPELVWKDTLLIPAGKTINIFTTYADFTGAFVMHCHILDHEDLGMMEVDEVVDDLATQMPVEMAGHHDAK
jgi:FtsP/CotA-like multicopper oxidase with cupredoxin domain